MTEIDRLNRRLAEGLGYIGGHPRFQWAWSADLFRFWRPNPGTDYKRLCWAGQLGKKWVLCQYRPPTGDWQSRYLHELQGGYIPMAETAGPIPTAERTQGYIRLISEQMERGARALKANAAGRKDDTTLQCEAAAEKQVADAEAAMMEDASSWEPWSWKLGEPREPGDHDGPIAFQVGGTRDEQQPAAA